jgi:hypothetical protein
LCGGAVMSDENLKSIEGAAPALDAILSADSCYSNHAALTYHLKQPDTGFALTGVALRALLQSFLL